MLIFVSKDTITNNNKNSDNNNNIYRVLSMSQEFVSACCTFIVLFNSPNKSLKSLVLF